MKDGKRISIGILIALLFITLMMTDCCNEKSLEITSQGEIRYSLKWDNTLPGHQAPNCIRYCFYPSNKGARIQIDSDSTGLRFTLPPDTYKLLIFNCDGKNVEFRNMDKFETAEAFIAGSKARAGAVSSVAPLYGIAIEDLTIEAGEGSPIKFTPVALVREVNIKIKVDGMDYVKGCKGTLSGVSTAISLSRQLIMTDKKAEAAFQTTPSEEGVEASLMILGKPAEKGEEQPEPSTNEMTLDFSLEDGSTVSTTIDLGASLNETEGSTVDVDIEATVEKSPVFSIKINRWDIANGDSLVIE